VQRNQPAVKKKKSLPNPLVMFVSGNDDDTASRMVNVEGVTGKMVMPSVDC
jgi:hypothetical protein